MKLTHYRQGLRPRHVFATSQGGVDYKQTIVVQLEHDGVAGLGEVVAAALYGQTLEACEAALDSMLPLIGEDPFALESIVARLIARHDDQRAAIAGVDSALHDWIGKRLNIPVWRLLGLDRPRRRTTFTIGVADMAEVRVKIDEALAAGYDALKVKVGVEQDHEVLSLIRSRFDGPLLLDANQAWQPDEAVEKVKALAPYKPAMIEQPLRAADSRQMARLCELRVAPIYADESCERPDDVVRLHGYVDGVNIKFTKCGGIREALKMIRVARGLGMGTMLGCFVSSSLAIAPPLCLASLVDFIDLDGHLLLAEDPFEGIANTGSVVELSERPGLGIQPRATR
jgi:L-alanine-DL-glutamate epimerase-like enolase superfamily enzyme